MKLTNNHGLPELILEAIRNDPYDAGRSDVTVTQLVGPPQVSRISREHWAQIEEDATDRIWALWGQAVHHILERAAKPPVIAEKRMFATIRGKTVSGQIDLLYPSAGHIEDWKTVATYRTKGGMLWTWKAQINLLAHLCFLNGVEIRTAAIGVFYRDWTERKARKPEAYPRAPVEMFEVQLWDRAYIEQFLNDRLIDYYAPIIRPCTNEERWYRGEEFAVMKASRKTAVRVFDTKPEAMTWMLDNGVIDADGVFLSGHSLEHRPGEYVRCPKCPARVWCPQWQTELGNPPPPNPLG